jgi:lipopolysaccharide cholinephosphotransferase
MNPATKKDLSELRFASQEVVDLIYDTLECVHQVLTENNIPYTIFSGTALGAKRHGGLIPWDDDADTAILGKDEQRLVALSDTFAKHGFTLRLHPYFGYRLYHATLSKPRARDAYPYPFIDIFLMKDTGTSYEYSTEDAREFWPQRPLPYGCFDRLVDVQFGHLILRGLSTKDLQEHLDDNYGKDWPYVAWREFDHFYYENVTDVRIKLNEGKQQRPALHSKFQQSTTPFKSMLNQTISGNL